MDQIEKSVFLKLFNRNGYVLDFSTNDFDIFTLESVGIALCQKYQRSKGASLTAFAHNSSESQVIKLFTDLLKYYELHFLEKYDKDSEEFQRLYTKCKLIIEKYQGNELTVFIPSVKCIDREYIKKLSDRAMNDVNNGNYDSAITKSRTLLEEVFCYVIEKKGETPSESGDIGKLYNQVKQLYNMHQNKDIDKRINGLLSGLEKILSSIAEMRNKNSDSHGIGAKRIDIDEHHARLFVNSAMTMSDFVLAVGNKKVDT
jgi:hypothetical protein